MSFDIDFDAAYHKAEKLALCADEMLQQNEKLNEVIAEIRAAWVGNTAEAYIRKLLAISERLQADGTRCREDALAFRNRIDVIRKADEEAARAIASTAGTTT